MLKPISPSNNRFLLNSQRKKHIINKDEILFLEAENNYTKIHMMDSSEYLLSATLSSVLRVIDSRDFFRCHRSFAVNMPIVKNVITERNLCYIVFENKIKIVISRRKKSELLKSDLLLAEEDGPGIKLAIQQS